MSATAELLLDARCGVGESPVWSARHQALYWVDIPARRLWCWQAASGESRFWEAKEQIACIALQAGSETLESPPGRPKATNAPSGGSAAWGPVHGRWVAGMEGGIALLTPADDGSLAVEPLAGVDHPHPGMRFNDGRCDRQGRFWAGTMVADMSLAAAQGTVYRLDGGPTRESLQATPVIPGFITPNGMAFSPDGRTMYLSDSHPLVQTVWAFDYDPDTGTPSNRRVFIDFKPLPGRPDGAAVDADGCYWICGNDAGLVHRFTPEGRLDRSLPVPVKKPAMCAFGGPGLDTLFVTSIRPGGDVSDQPQAGGLFALRPGVRGLDEPQGVV